MDKKGREFFLVIIKQIEVVHVNLHSSLGREGTPSESDQRKTSDGRTNLTTEDKLRRGFSTRRRK